MSQANYTIAPNQSGTAYRTADNDGKAAIVTNHKGSTAPSYKVAGMTWLDDTTSTNWILKLYDGTDWITIGSFNTTSNLFTPANSSDQVLSQGYAAASGTNTITATLSPAVTSYTTGGVYRLLIANENTGAVTVNFNSVGAKNLYKNVNQALVKGDLPAGAMIIMVYDGTNMQLVSVTTIKNAKFVNKQTGTSYTYLYTDREKLVTHSNSSAIAGTLPQAGTAGFEDGFMMWVENRNTGALTITPTTSTIDGASSLVLNQNEGVAIFSDGTNYFTSRGKPNITSVGWPTGHMDVGKPVFASTTVTINYVRVRDSSDAYNLQKDTALVLDITSTGNANGIQTARAANTWYYIYIIGKTDGTVALFASATNEFISGTISLPSGYTLKKQLRTAFCTDGSSNIKPCYIGAGWPYAAEHFWDVQLTSGIAGGGKTAGTSNVLANGGSVSWTDVVCTSWMPPTSTLGIFHTRTNGTSSSDFYMRPNGASHNGHNILNTGDGSSGEFKMRTDSSQTIEYSRGGGSGGGVYIDVTGWVWDYPVAA